MRINKLLVANRGEIARRVTRTARSMGIKTVAVYVEADTVSPFVREACEAVRLTSDSYLDVDGIVRVAIESGADAVHPGYGFLSENPAFAQAVIDADLTWVGPPADSIAAMGDKLAAKRVADDVGVPTLDMVEDIDDAYLVGYPLLVKAAAGGGGKGMRVIESHEQLLEGVAAAKREALAAFGDDRVFLERYVAKSRHVEVQILGDQYGSLVHLGERECSIQRRHQKIIEEAPSPAVDSEMRTRLGESALRLAQALGYQSAGTVEFLVDNLSDENGQLPFWFLEVNTRIQVEHPVTEETTGIDIVREQLRIAMGERLGFSQSDIQFNGHAVEARLYAEDPQRDFLPASGTLVAWDPPTEPAVRVDSGVERDSEVSLRFDPMLAKVIAWAPERHEAIKKLALALERIEIAGVTTNRNFLVACLREEAFLAGDTTTDFLERLSPTSSGMPSATQVRMAAYAAALWEQEQRRASTSVLEFMPSGWTNSRLPPERFSVRHDSEEFEVRYQRQRNGTFALNGQETVRVLSCSADEIDILVAGQRVVARMCPVDDRLFVHSPWGDIEFHALKRFPEREQTVQVGGLVAPMPGVVIDVRVVTDQCVSAGDVLVILEAMKMEHAMTTQSDGVVSEVRVGVGDQVVKGAVLVVLTDEEQRPE